MREPRPRAAERGPFLWLLLVLAFLLAGGWLLWRQDLSRGAQGPEYSVTRTDERGAAAVFRLYRQAGLDPRVWDRELSALKEPGVVILIAPAREKAFGEMKLGATGDILPHEIEALDRWVSQGNVAVIFSGEPNSLYRGLGLIADQPKAVSAAPAEPAQPGVLARGVSELKTSTPFGFKFGRKEERNPMTGEEMNLPQPIPEIPAEQWLVLFAKKEGPAAAPQVVSAARGKGLYVAVNDLFPAGNVGIAQGDNARFMLNLARLGPAGGTVWFDEYHKRNAERGLVSYLRERSLAPVLLYALLIVGVLFWRSGVRFGAPEPLVKDPRRDSAEYLHAVAALYRNAGMAREALATIYADFRRRMAGALRMDGLTDLDEVARRYEMRTGRPGIEARRVLVEVEAVLARPKLDEAEALQHCERLTRLDRELHRHQAIGDEPAHRS